MSLITIGEFAHRTRLSAKALRLYDQLGLVVPAQVDAVSGYRLYSADQVESARLVGLLRWIGMLCQRSACNPLAVGRALMESSARPSSQPSCRRDGTASPAGLLTRPRVRCSPRARSTSSGDPAAGACGCLSECRKSRYGPG
jgi:hypothetical protein